MLDQPNEASCHKIQKLNVEKGAIYLNEPRIKGILKQLWENCRGILKAHLNVLRHKSDEQRITFGIVAAIITTKYLFIKE